MRAGGSTGLSHPGNLLLGSHLFPRADQYFRGMGVQGGDPTAMVDLDRVSITRARAGAAYHSLARRADRIARRGAQVDARVKFIASIQGIGAVTKGAGDLLASSL